MSKNVKRILCGALVLGTLCCAGLAIPNNMFITRADAAFTASVQKGEIKTMEVKTIEGEKLDFVNNFDDCKVIDYDGNDKEFYVVLPDDSKGVRFSLDIKQDGSTDKDKHDDDDDDDDDDEKEDKRYVARIFKSSSDTASAYKADDDIEIDGAGQTFYVRVYRSERKFKNARNDDKVSRCYETYKINVKRKSAKLSDAKESSELEVTNDKKVDLPHIDTNFKVETKTYKNEWVQSGQFWKRYNENGVPLRNAWFKDNDEKWYYLQSNSYMTTGWRYIDGKWYYFDKSGVMQNGWLQTKEGKWYYLSENGSMASNTTIDGYKLGANGQYVK